ncbi:MAG: hypothetical protein H6510_03180 [Acidobacteria bacterium]|nr:hypothetical protein [Acidobacteriota bacterium]MCB9396800.1 hypothetical protein [Acidobacteriota bacterium]
MKLVFMLCVSICLFAGEVKNGLVPQGKPMTLELKQNLVINADSGEDAYIWGGVIAFDADKEGNIFVGDAQNVRVLKFDKNGKYIKTIASKGAGPGEILAVTGVGCLDDGRLAVFQMLQGTINCSIHLFDHEGKFIEVKQTPSLRFMNVQKFGRQGKYISGMLIDFDGATGGMKFNPAVVDYNLQIIHETGAVDRGVPDWANAGQPSFWGDFLGNNIRAALKIGIVGLGEDGTIYTIPNRKYEISCFKADEKTPFLKISKEYKPIPQSEEEILAAVEPIKDSILRQMPAEGRSLITAKVVEEALKIAEFPSVKPPVYGFISLGTDGFLIIRDINMLKSYIEFDIFSLEGKFLGDFKWDWSVADVGQAASSFLARDGQFYYVGFNENEEPQLTRYAYKLVPAK